MTELQLSDEDRDRLQKSRGKGHHHFSTCQVCGYLEWRCSETEKPDGVTVRNDLNDGWDRRCPRCADASYRAPEVTSWVLGVIEHQERIRKQNAQH